TGRIYLGAGCAFKGSASEGEIAGHLLWSCAAIVRAETRRRGGVGAGGEAYARLLLQISSWSRISGSSSASVPHCSASNGPRSSCTASAASPTSITAAGERLPTRRVGASNRARATFAFSWAWNSVLSSGSGGPRVTLVGLSGRLGMGWLLWDNAIHISE